MFKVNGKLLIKGKCISDLKKNSKSLSANPDKSVKNPVQRTSMVLQREEDIEQFKDLLLDGCYCEVEELLIQCTDSLLLSKGLHTLCNVCLPHMRVINVKGCDFDYQLLNELFMYYNFPILTTICVIQQSSSVSNTSLSKEECFDVNTVSFSVKQESIKACYKRDMYPAHSFSVQCTKGKRVSTIPQGEYTLQYNNEKYSLTLPKSNTNSGWKTAIANVLITLFLITRRFGSMVYSLIQNT